MKHYNIPIFINHIGCPNSCVFCSQKKINGVETDTLPSDVLKGVEEYLEYLPKESEIEVAFFGGTFTGLSYSLQREYLEVVKPFIDSGKIKGIRLSTRPDYIDEKILIQLKKYGVTTIELGVQSLDQKVLDLTERAYEVERVYKSVELIKKFGFKIGIQLMLGLPGADFQSDYETAKKTVFLKPDMVRIYPSLVLSETKMERMYLDGEYKPYTLEEAVEIGTKIYALIEKNRIKIIRVGLQPSEDLREDGVIIAGPFHPAFRDLIEGKIYSILLDGIFKTGEEKAIIFANEKNLSKIVGNKGINKKRYGLKLEIHMDNKVPLNQILINGVSYTREKILGRVLDYEESNIK